MVIRTVTEDDAPALLRIYSYYVEHTAITYEWTVPTEEEFRGRIRSVLAKYPYLCAEEDGRIVGYACAGPFKARAAYAWSVETTIYLDRGARRAGIGKKLYAALEDALRLQGILNANACVAYPEEEDEFLTRNSAAFHQHIGYRLVGEFRRCGYKFGRWYGMVWLEKHLGEHPAEPRPVRPFDEIRPELAERFGIR